MAGIMKFVYALIIFLSFFLLQRTSKVSHFNIYKFPYFVLLYLFACTQYLSLFFFFTSGSLLSTQYVSVSFKR